MYEEIWPLRIVMSYQQPPLFYVEKTGNGSKVVGIILEIISKVTKKFNITYDLKLTNNSDGLQLMLSKEEIDVMLSVEALHRSTNPNNHYTSYLFYGDTFIYSNKVWRELETLSRMWHSIELNVWICLLFALIATSLIFWLRENMETNFQNKTEKFMRHLWMLYGSFFAETIDRIPEEWSFKILAFIWMMSVFVVSTVFSGAMKAQLAIDSSDDLDTLTDILEHKNVQPFVQKGLLESTWLNGSEDKNMKEIANRISAFGGELDNLDQFFAYHLTKEKGRTALLTGHRRFLLNMERYCDESKIGYWWQGSETINMYPTAIQVGKHLPKSILEEINVWILRIGDAQVSEHFYQMRSYQSQKCFWSRSNENSYNSVNLHGLTLAFKLWSIGLFCSVLLLINEVFLNKKIWYRRIVC